MLVDSKQNSAESKPNTQPPAAPAPRRKRNLFPHLDNDFGEDAEERGIEHLSDM